MVRNERSPAAAGAAAPPRRRDPARLRLLLAHGEPAEVLARLLADDPLALRERAGRRIVARRLLLDADRVYLDLAARVALDAPHWRGRPALDVWLAERVDAAIDSVLARPAGDPPGGIWRDLARPFGLDPRVLADACARFSRRPAEEREAFFQLLVERRSLAEAARSCGVGAVELARRARRALDTFLESFPLAVPNRSEVRA